MNTNSSPITYTSDLTGVDWQELTARLKADDFDNGRTPAQLRISFENSYAVCFAWTEGQIIGKARVLSDGVCNACIVDVWTYSDYRRQGIAAEMMNRLLKQLEGQHVYLQADEDVVGFYERLGFHPHPNGLATVVGQWLQNDTREAT